MPFDEVTEISLLMAFSCCFSIRYNGACKTMITRHAKKDVSTC